MTAFTRLTAAARFAGSCLSPQRTRTFSASALTSAVARVSVDNEWDVAQLPQFESDDSTFVGHRLIRERQQLLKYLRLIEFEVPKLAAFRKPFVPPTDKTPLVLRSFSYGGEPHPAEHKASLTVPVSRLPLHTPAAVHKFKLLAGVRWTPTPPKDAGLGPSEFTVDGEDASGPGAQVAKEGYFKIASEDFPEVRMNVKWCSDVLDRMLAEANDEAADTFADVPLDLRHLDSAARKRRTGGHSHGLTKRATLKDFPKEWLPSTKVVSLAS